MSDTTKDIVYLQLKSNNLLLDELTNQGLITSNVIVTDAEYEALTIEEKENGAMYFIKE